MTEILTLGGMTVETDAPVAEMEDALGTTRAAFLKRAAIFGGGTVAVASATMGFPAMASASKASDIAILNFALTLEYLESTFYAIAKSKAPLTGEAKRLATIVADHEAQHVAALLATIPKLGGTPVKKPKFNFGGAFASQSSFLQTSMALEDTGVGAYNGAGPSLTLTAVKQAAASIVAVEAEHASWVRGILGLPPAPVAFDVALSKSQVLAAAGPFIVGSSSSSGMGTAGAASGTPGSPGFTG